MKLATQQFHRSLKRGKMKLIIIALAISAALNANTITMKCDGAWSLTQDVVVTCPDGQRMNETTGECEIPEDKCADGWTGDDCGEPVNCCNILVGGECACVTDL